MNNSLNVGISHYLRNVIDALVIKNSSKYFCKELCDNYSNVYDYNGDIYPCIRLIGTHLKSDPVIEKYNIKSNEKCKNCWAKNICRDCVADIILGNNRAPYEKKVCYKKSLYQYALFRCIELMHKDKKTFDKLIKNFYENYLF